MSVCVYVCVCVCACVCVNTIKLSEYCLKLNDKNKVGTVSIFLVFIM